MRSTATPAGIPVLQGGEDVKREGIDLSISPTWKWERLNWGMRISLVAPLEVRNNRDAAELARIARGLVLRQHTLNDLFRSYTYTRADWLREWTEPPC